MPTIKHGSSIGRLGETLAAQYLIDKGYLVVQQNWRHGKLGEIDIIAFDPTLKVLAFIEVKTRSHLKAGHPLEAINQRKQQQIIGLTQQFISEITANPIPTIAGYEALRFDAISILLNKQRQATEILHLENAFSA